MQPLSTVCEVMYVVVLCLNSLQMRISCASKHVSSEHS